MPKSTDVQQNSAPDGLLGASPEHAIELSEDALDAVAGGEPAAGGVQNPSLGSTLTKVKSTDKANAAIRAYVLG